MNPRFDVIEIHTDLPGYLFCPKQNGKHPAIVFIHGSDGGSFNFINYPNAPPRPTGKEALFVKMAFSYAQRGFATLALSYFDFPTTKKLSIIPPNELVRVDIKNITEYALAKMRTFDFVDENSVGMYGYSRGAEHVLLLGSLAHPNSKGMPDYIVSVSPTAYVWGGIQREVAEQAKCDELFDWSLVPHTPAWSYDDIDIIHQDIHFEDIRVPFFVSTFKNDNVWESQDDIIDIKNRLIKHNLGYIEYDFTALINQDIPQNIKKGTNVLIELPMTGHCYPDRITLPNETNTFLSFINEFIRVHSDRNMDLDC